MGSRTHTLATKIFSFVCWLALHTALQAEPVDQWSLANPVFGGATLQAVASGAAWIAVGDAGTIGTSSDGRQWTRQTSGTSADLGAAVFAAGKYVVGGTDGLVLTSTDGRNWSVSRAPDGNNGAPATGATFGQGQFVIVYQDGTALVSPDAVSWKKQVLTAPDGEVVFRAVTYGNCVFVAVGDVLGSADQALVLTSTDAQNWTRRARGVFEGFAISLLSVTHGGGQFVATASGGHIATSNDGFTWFDRSLPDAISQGSEPRLVGVAYGDGLYIAVSDALGRYYISSDGANWTRHSPPPEVAGVLSFTDLVFGNGLFVSTGVGGQTGFRTFNDDWTIGTGFQLTGEPAGFVCGDGVLVAVGYSGEIATSRGGYFWTTQLYTGGRTRVAYGAGQFVTGAWVSGSRAVLTSPDGLDWTLQPFDGELNAFVYARGKFVAVGTQRIATSPDGINWTARNTGFEKTFLGVAEGNGRFVAVGYFGAIATSADGETWTLQSPPTGGHFQTVAFGNGRFVAVERDAVRMWTSADGVNWSELSPPSAPAGGFSTRAGFTDLVHAADRFVATLGSDIVTSTDGVTWRIVPRALGTEEHPHFHLAYCNGSFFAIGRNSQLYRTAPDASAILIEAISGSSVVAHGSKVTLSVSATGANLRYQWYRGASPDRASPVAGATAAQFTTPALSSDAQYWVRVIGDAGALDSPTVTVRLQRAPSISTAATEYETIDGDTVTLATTVEGVPAPTVQWYRGARGDTSQPVSGGQSASLSFVAGDTAGTFWMRATNSAGNADSNEIRVIPWTKLNQPPLLADTLNVGGLLIGVGGERISTSSDGIQWSTVAEIRGADFKDIEQGAGLFVAVDERGAGYYSSPDLINWTPRNESAANGAQSLARGNGVFVAAGSTSYRSTNGTAWSPITLPAGITFTSVLFDGLRFVAAGRSHDQEDLNRSNVGVIFTSTNGQTWTRRGLNVLPETVANANTAFESLNFVGGKYIATGGNTSVALVSSDTVNWTRVTVDSLAGGRPRSVAFAHGRFVMATWGQVYYTSVDALTWTGFAAPDSGITPTWLHAPNGDLLVSTDGTFGIRGIFRLEPSLDWTVLAGSLGDTPTALRRIVYGAGQAVGIGFRGVYSAPTPARWQLASDAFSASDLNQLAYLNGRYVIPSDQPGQIRVSRDGRTWGQQALPTNVRITHTIAAGERVFAIAGSAVMSSTDTENWTPLAQSGLEAVTDVAFGNGTWVLTGYGTTRSNFAYSTDGRTWNVPTVRPNASSIEAIAFGHGLFLAVGRNFQDLVVLTSPNGETWTSHPSPVAPSAALHDVLFSVDRFIATSAETIYFSLDGIVWQTGPSDWSFSDSVSHFNGAVVSGASWLRARDPRATSIRSISMDQAVASGQRVTLTTSAEGVALRYQWYEGAAGDRSAPIAGATQSTFTTPPIVTNKHYWVRVTGTAGSVDSRAVYVTPAVAPVITASPYSADLENASEGSVLRVEAESVSTLTYQWYAGESGDRTSPLPGANGRTLAVPRITSAVSFWVRVSNAHGSTDSRAVLVTPWESTTGPDVPNGATFSGRAVAFGAGKFVIPGFSSRFGADLVNGVALSEDGRSWTFTGAPALGPIAFGQNRFAAISDFPADRIYASTDAAAWDLAFTAPTGTRFSNIHFIGSRFLAPSTNGKIASSTDGLRWTSADVSPGNAIVAVAFGNSVYVAAGTGGRLFKSTNGTAWTAVTSGVTADFTSVAYGSGRFVAPLADGSVLTSTDGTAWSSTPIETWDGRGTLGAGSRIAFVHDRFFTTGSSTAGGGMTSPDGIVWGPSASFAGLAHGDGMFVRLRGTIQRSASSSAPALIFAPVAQSVPAGQTVTFTAVATGDGFLNYQWRKNGSALSDTNRIHGTATSNLSIASATAADAGNYDVIVTNTTGSIASPTAALAVVVPPTITSQPASRSAAAGQPVSLSIAASSAGGAPAPTFQWQRNGVSLTGATSSTLTLPNLQPAATGLYAAVATAGGVAGTSEAAIVGVTTTAKVIGAGQELSPANIVHPNGNTFDQVLLTGAAEAITADHTAGQITRTSFIDLDDDIVQVELSGPGTLSLVLDQPTGPAAPLRYNQPGVSYMKGHAGIVITGADERTNVSVFTVGRLTAVDPTGGFNFLQPVSAANNPANNGSPLFAGHDATDYDGIADIAFIAISTTNGKFGSVRTANAHYFAAQGLTGVYAPGVAFVGPLFMGDITAFDTAIPVIRLASTVDVRVTGGNLLQANGAAVQISGIAQLKFTAGGDSHSGVLPALPNAAVLQQDGVDVTAEIVVNPAP